MKKIKIIIPIIAIGIFCIIYFVVLPTLSNNKQANKMINEFEKGLNSINPSYKKEKVKNKFESNQAYSYKIDEKTLSLYVYNKNSKVYSKGVTNGYIGKGDERLYGIFLNNCVLFIEDGYPNQEDILSLFERVSLDYVNNK